MKLEIVLTFQNGFHFDRYIEPLDVNCYEIPFSNVNDSKGISKHGMLQICLENMLLDLAGCFPISKYRYSLYCHNHPPPLLPHC